MARKAAQQFQAIAPSLLALLVLSVLIPASLVGLAGWWTYCDRFAEAAGDAQDAVEILHEYVQQRLDDDATTLQTLRDRFDRPEEAVDRVADSLKLNRQVKGAVIVDRSGTLLLAAPPTVAGHADRDAFHVLETADRPLFVGRAPDGAETALLALRRNAPDGAFNGMIGVSIETAPFQAMFDRVASRRSATILLCRSDGAIIGRAPALPDAALHLPAAAPLLVDLQQASAGSFVGALEDGDGADLVAYRSLQPYPLVIAYRLHRAAVLAGWVSGFTVIAVIGIAAAFGLSAVTLAFHRGRAALIARENRLEGEIARRREAEAETRRSLDEALRANTAKSGFLAMMSHELRTPLNAIIGFSDMMANEMFGPLGNDRYKAYVADIAQSGTHLLRVINDILDLSRIDLGRLKPDVDLTDVVEVLEQTVRMVTPMAAKAGVAITLAAAPGLAGALADARLLKQAVLNVLSNAVKFTDQGGTVQVSANRLPDDGALVVEIRDTGIGMTADQIQLALEPFQQVDNSLHRKYEGAGLGLPLAKAFTEIQGGRFEIESVPGRGTAIRFILTGTAP
jgi:signal transduction histidine kinase